MKKILIVISISFAFYHSSFANLNYLKTNRYCKVCCTHKDFKNSSEDFLILNIDKGDSYWKISKKLHELGLTKNRFLFFYKSILLTWKKKIKYGTYQIHKNCPEKEIIKMVYRGFVVTHKISIPEGLTVLQISNIVDKHPCLTDKIIFLPNEGSLLPNTYFFTTNEKRQNIIDRMKLEQQIFLKEISLKYPSLNLTINQAIILASIVEKETSLKEEKPLIAGVFLNRLKKGMFLQADPTIIYYISKGKGKINRPLTRKDWKIDSNYNTYKYKGLPPTPICCPGKESIISVFCPITTNFLFFVKAGKNKHAFSENLKEHNKNVSRKK